MTGSATFRDHLAAYLRTSRWEYLLAEIPGLFVVFFMGASSFDRLLAPVVLEGIVVFILLYFGGFIINAYMDQEIDRRYTIFKNKIPEAVELLGPRRLLALLGVQLVLAFLLTLHISMTMGSWLPLALVTVGTFFGLGYSIPPLQFKVRGMMHAVSLTVSAFFIPAVFLLFVMAGQVTLAPLIIIVGFSILHYGIAFANQAIDYLEDKAGGVTSPPVLWGMENSLRAALGAIVAGLLVEFVGLYYLVAERQGLLALLPGLSPAGLFALMVPLVLLGYFVPARGLWRMYRATLTRPLEEAIRYMKEICHYNQWQASGIIGLMAAVGVLFIGGLQGA